MNVGLPHFATRSVVLTTSQTAVVLNDGTGTAADIRAYVLPTP
jgi:hypothetical protein